jgi:phytoene synthase
VRVPALEIEYAYRECEQATRRCAANFYYGIRLLPRDKRWAMSAVYAFARRIDDIGDGTLSGPDKLAALVAERRALERLTDDEGGRDPVLIGLAHAHRRYHLPLDALTLLIEGVELDVLGAEYETFDELVAYCRRVAGSIGRLCTAIFTDGHADEETDRLADDLGVALQLTNVLRDVREDRDLGRVYLPAEDLRRFGCDPALTAGPETVALIRFEAERARAWFDHGLGLARRLDGRSASCLLAMAGIYRTILARIEADPGLVLRGRISLPPWEKAWVAACSLSRAGLGHGVRS